MMDSSVPMASSAWSGIGTVIVPSEVRRCVTTWLPRRRTSVNPCCSRMRQTSRPERTRSLTIDDVERRHEYAGPQALGDLSGVGRLEEEGDRLTEVRGGLFDRRPLAGDVSPGHSAT